MGVIVKYAKDYWSVVSTHLKNISQIRPFPQVGLKIKHIWNHHLDYSEALLNLYFSPPF